MVFIKFLNIIFDQCLLYPVIEKIIKTKQISRRAVSAENFEHAHLLAENVLRV